MRQLSWMLLAAMVASCDDVGVCDNTPPSPTYGLSCENDTAQCEEPFSCMDYDDGPMIGQVFVCTKSCETQSDCPAVCNSHCGVLESECVDSICKKPMCK
jgi:hypothetical protein